MSMKTYSVAGLACADCAERVRAAVSHVEGVSDCQVDHAAGTLTVWFALPDPPEEQIGAAVEGTGYALVRDRRREDKPILGFVHFLFSKTETTLVAVSGLLMLLGLMLVAASTPPWSQTVPFAAAILVGGYPVARHAFQELYRSRSLGINTLMVIAVAGAVLIGEWAEAAVVVVLFSLGEALEGFAADQVRGALDHLLDLAPPVALRMLPGGEIQEVPVEKLAIGDRVLVRPGDRVSVDGVVLAGQSAVDESPITGESVPVEKEPNGTVFAGTVNTHGALEVNVTRLAADNTLNRMVALVREAQSRQAPVQRFIDRFARVYTPAVGLAAALVAAVPPLLLGQPFWGDQGWLMRALQMLVIACPCALVISTPVSLVSAMTNAASRGVLIKGGRTLEALSRVGAFAFDKTGTLTQGHPVITDVIDVCACEECEENCGLQHAASLEVQSSHPLAQALVAEAQARQVLVPHAENVTLLSGRGMEGVVNGRQVTVASHAYFDEQFPHPPSVCRRADELAAEGKTVIMVRHAPSALLPSATLGTGRAGPPAEFTLSPAEGEAEGIEAGCVCALFGVADTLRPSSHHVVADLKAKGIHTIMLTGDSQAVAAEVGRQAGVDEVRARLLPEDKVSAVVVLQEKYRAVAMVGDGVNDAPALAQADVGIAMGGAGSAQAMETADVVLMGDDLTQLPFVVWLSGKTRAIVTANIGLALAVKAAIFALAAMGLATLWMAIVADVGASVAVILNGMRLRRMGSRSSAAWMRGL